MAIALTAQADPIGQQKAQQIANQFLTKNQTIQNGSRRIVTAQPNLVCKDLGFSHLFTFTDEAGGFVVVAGDDRVAPVLAYSTTDVLNPNNMPESMQMMLLGYDQQIGNLPPKAAPVQQSEQPQREVIAPLIKTMWHQYLPFCYNTPFDTNENTETLVGCTALALAQLMNYYQYPAKTTITIPAYTTYSGYDLPALEPTTFDYSKLHINYPTLDYKEEVDMSDESVKEITKLLIYAGCAIHTNYSIFGSSAYFELDSIAKYFGYDKNCRRLRACDYPHETWEEMVYNELKAGRPVPYTGGALGGQNHMFIIDGYDGQGYFHANIGDTGWGTSNVYYKLDVINSYEIALGQISFSGYNAWQTGYFGFQPDKGNNALPHVDFDYGNYTLNQSDYTRNSTNADFQNVELKAEIKRNDMNGQTLDYGWGLFQDGLLKQVAGSATTSQETASMNMKMSFGSTLADGTYQLYPIYRYHGATEWESYMEFGYTDEMGTPLHHYTATIQGNNLHIGLSSLEPNITIDRVEYFSPYEGEKLDVRAFLTNGGTNYENHLLIWVDGEMKTGVGTYTNPGMSGQVDFCFGAPAKGVHTIKISTDAECNDVIYNGQVTITEAPICKLEGQITLKGHLEKDMQTFIYKKCEVTCTITNIGSTTFNNLVHSFLSSYIIDKEGTGGYITKPEIGVPSTPWRRVWYLNLEPGESVDLSFEIGESCMVEDLGYILGLDYYNNSGKGWEIIASKSLLYMDEELTGVNTISQPSSKNGNCYDLQGRRISTNPLKSGLYIQDGKKILVK